MSTMFVSGCQTLSAPKLAKPAAMQVSSEPVFNISGKLGVRFLTPQKQWQSSSVYYGWAQNNKQFNIEVAGALGIGKTTIQGNASEASIQNANIQPITAPNPEELLYQVAGWRAPLTQMPYFIVGKTPKFATNTVYDNQNRLLAAVVENSNKFWLVELSYKTNNHLPSKLKATLLQHSENATLSERYTKTQQRIIMTIEHDS